MADTLKFGPEWLRALSDGNSVVTPPPSPAVPFGKYKLADYRYGREEMLALFNPNSEVPEDLHAVSSILVEKAQEPMCLLPLSEEEQRIMSQSVNSVAVLRMMGRGAPPLRGGRGGGMERGRGRGRGRGEGYMQRGMSYDETDTGGFGRGRSLSKPDGWEEAGAKRFERTFQSRYDDTGSRGSWRDRGRDGGFEFDRSGQSNLNRNQGGFSRQYQRSRSSESYDDEDTPEWIVLDHGDGNELGTFDASGAFVSNKKKEEGSTSEEVAEVRFAAPPPDEPISVKKEQKPEQTSGKNQVESNSKDTDDNKPEKLNTNQRPNKTLSPRPSDTRENSTNKSNSSQSENKTKLKSSASEKETSKVSSKEEALHTHAVKNISNSTFANDLVTDKTPSRNLSPPDLKAKKEEDIKSKSEADALKKLKETAENMVADMTVEDEKEKALLSTDPMRGALPPDHENSLKWLYRDPQGDLQGPFTASEMAEWFSAGYFTMNLLVKRGIDEKFSPLGELIKRWGRVPFLPGPTPPPLLNSPQLSPDISQQQQQQREREREQEEQALQVLQQHMMIQQQIMQQQLIRQTLTQPWLHLQQIQGLMHQLQENEQFKSLPLLQQQQIAIQMLLKQPPPLLYPAQQQQQSHSPQQNLSPRTPPPLETAAAAGVLHPSFHRSLSNPGETTSHSHAEEATLKGLSQPTSIWDIDAKSQLQPIELEAHLKKLQREQEEAERRKKLQEEERKRQAEIERKHQELKKEQEEIQRRKEAMEKELQELERKKQMELQRIEEEKKKAEERQRIEEERRKQEELRRKEEEDRKRREEEERHQREEIERRQQELQQQKQQQELKRQQELKQQEIQRQQELRRQKEQEELEKQKQAEIQHRQELRQQEAMRKLQQEQLTNMQLPAHAQWASSPPSINPGIPQKTMAEIEQEERERQEIEEQKKKKQMEMQRQQSLLYQQQQQQQQKSWSTPVKAPVVASTRSLLEIQEEQARQFEVEKTSRDQQQQQVTKNMTISSASVWSGVAPSNWASEGAWGNALRASKGEPDSGDSLGFWDEAIISSGPLPKKQSGNKNSGNKGSADFPALGAILGQNRTVNTLKSKQVKSNKDEEAAQRLFQAHKPADDFTRWCENTLRNMDTSVDIPTFIAFLQEVESPYEVHDYVKSYLGETKAANDFAKQFLEKRSQYKNKSKPVTQEDSIWGPAPAVNPHEHRQQHISNTAVDNNDEQKGKGKKKKKMTKIDNSILGFTVHAAPDRFNVGELDTIDGK